MPRKDDLASAELRRLARSYAPALIELLRQMAKEGKTKSARQSARKVLEARGIKVD